MTWSSFIVPYRSSASDNPATAPGTATPAWPALGILDEKDAVAGAAER